jgi:hypothetical protein
MGVSQLLGAYWAREMLNAVREKRRDGLDQAFGAPNGKSCLLLRPRSNKDTLFGVAPRRRRTI